MELKYNDEDDDYFPAQGMIRDSDIEDYHNF
jgi:hypothetical protein